MPQEVNKEMISELYGAIMLYTGGYSEYRPISNNKFQAAEPLKKQMLENMSAGFFNDQDNLEWKGFIPDNCFIVKSKPKLIIGWTVPEHLRQLYFTSKKNSGKYFLPNILFLIKNNELHIYSYKEWKKGDTELYPVNFPNTYANGGICMGSASLYMNEAKSWNDLIDSGNNAFFSSKFSHSINKTVLKGQKDKKSFDYGKYKKGNKRGNLNSILQSSS